MRWACILLPQLALDATLRHQADPDAPLALVGGPTQRRVLHAVNPAARGLGLRRVCCSRRRLCEPMGNVSRAGGALAQVIRQYADRQRQRDPRLAARLNERANTFHILESGALANAKPADILQAYRDSTGFSQQLVSMAVRGDNEELIRNVKAFMEMAKQFEKVHDLLDMLGPLAGKREDQPPEEDHLAILSVHRSKGEEWPTVILPGWTEGIFPRSKEGIEEERRLAYVAVTRAIQNLIFFQPEDPVLHAPATSSRTGQCVAA